ncbi:MAG: response regulator transcription factor [Clostridiales bacterium]|nr:response regulator transcription factor [Clostridiales bacterium]MBQ2817225.1 response regulator transcription factor [Clostridia bacterium]
MAEKTRILVVDDDKNILQLIKLYLEKEGFEVVEAMRGDDGLKLFDSQPPNLVMLDIMLPGMDGWQVCREIRKTSNIPILMITAKDETFDKVLGLELGADDYITKPFDPKELIARTKAVLRRSQTSAPPEKSVKYPNLNINMTNYTITYRGIEIDMPPKEIELLFYLSTHPGKVFTRDQLLEHVWGYDYYGDSRTVDVHVKRIREKLEGSDEYGWQIKTVWGVGYKFDVRPANAD